MIKDSGVFPVTWVKGPFSNVNGKLVLTNRRLIFTSGRFQDVVTSIRGSKSDRADIPLDRITGIEKGFMATIKVKAGREYTFRGMRDATGWVSHINTARLSAGTVQGVSSFVRGLGASKPSSSSCQNCGTQLSSEARFCSNCGARVH